MVRIGRTVCKQAFCYRTGDNWPSTRPGLREWELSLRHHGNNTENGNELMRMGENGNIAIKKSHFRTSLLRTCQMSHTMLNPPTSTRTAICKMTQTHRHYLLAIYYLRASYIAEPSRYIISFCVSVRLQSVYRICARTEKLLIRN